MRIEFDDQEAGIAPQRYLYLPTVDDTAPSIEHLREGVAFIEQVTAQGGGVLVHCGSGVGRAPTMAAAYLVHTGLAPEQAWARIREVRPFIRPTDPQVAQLERFSAQQGS
jgi:protein-tyrosine phosphatase